MNFEKIVRETFLQLLSEFELRKLAFRGIIQKNTDTLTNKSSEWFKGEIPVEFRDVIVSLNQLNTVFEEQNRDFARVSESEFEVFSVNDLLVEIKDEFEKLTGRTSNLECEKDPKIQSARIVFKEAFSGILLCLFQFAEESTKINFKIYEVMSSVKIDLDLFDLGAGVPDLQKLMRPLYSYYTGSGYNFHIGLEAPVQTMKKIGGIVNVSVRGSNDQVSVTITFPSYEFLKTVDDIRRSFADIKTDHYGGEVVVSVSDSILEMVLRENLSEYGYSLRISNVKKIITNKVSSKALIIDSETFDSLVPYLEKGKSLYGSVIVITYSDERKHRHIDGIIYVSMPFEVQSLVDYIERRR